MIWANHITNSIKFHKYISNLIRNKGHKNNSKLIIFLNFKMNLKQINFKSKESMNQNLKNNSKYNKFRNKYKKIIKLINIIINNHFKLLRVSIKLTNVHTIYIIRYNYKIFLE